MAVLGIVANKNIQNGTWYTNTRKAEYKLSDIIPNAAKALNWPDAKYVPHSLRVIAINALRRHGCDNKQVMSVSGYRSEAGLRTYQRETVETRTDTAKLLSSVSLNKTTRKRQ